MCKSSAHPVQTLSKSVVAVHNLCANPRVPLPAYVVKRPFSAPNPQLQTPYFSTVKLGILPALFQSLSTSSTGPITKKTILESNLKGVIA